MKIDWSEVSGREVFGLANVTRFREIRKIHFVNIYDEENKEVLEYLVSNYPDKLRIFAFEADTDYGNGDFYVEGIEKVSVWIV